MRLASLAPFFVGALIVAPAKAEFAVTEDGVRVHYETMGHGVPIFLIAGGPGDSSVTLKQTHSLLRSCGKLVFVDNRGRGISERTPPYTLENDLQDIESVRQALRCERIIVYGHSYGSMVAMAFAARNPDHTMALITTGAVHGARVWQQRNIDWVKSFLASQYPEKWEEINKLRSRGHKTGDDEIVEIFDQIDFLFTRHPYSRWQVGIEFDRGETPAPLQVNRAVYLAMVGPDPEWSIGGTLQNVELLPELKNYKGPALIMGGRFDWISPPINQFEIAGELDESELVIFERSGHLLYEDEPLRFVNVVTDFILRVSPDR